MPPLLPICLRGNSHPIIWEHPASRDSREPPCLLRWDRHPNLVSWRYRCRRVLAQGWEVGGKQGEGCGGGVCSCH